MCGPSIEEEREKKKIRYCGHEEESFGTTSVGRQTHG